MIYKNLLYCLASLSFCVVVGAGVYEHIAVVPRWSAAPPRSLSMIQGAYGLNAAPFWKSIHPVTLVLLLVSLFLFWHTERRMFLSITIVSYVLVLIATFIFFVPELISITSTPYTDAIDSSLLKRAKLWETLSLVRLFIIAVLAIILLYGLTKPAPVSG